MHLQLVGAKRAEVLGRSCFQVYPEGPDPAYAEAIRQLCISFRRVIETGQSESMPVQRYDLPHHESEDGSLAERYWSPVNSPVIGPDRVVQYVITRAEDVTALMQLKRKEEEHGQTAKTERLLAEQMQTELLFSSRLLAESQHLVEQRNQCKRTANPY